MTFANGWPPFYDERPSKVLVETSQLYLAYSALAILVGLLLILPGVRGVERIYFILRWFLSLLIGSAILACLQGVSWHTGVVSDTMPYRSTGNDMVMFKVGLMIGLEKFNVTLIDTVHGVSGQNLTISEEFHFLHTDDAIDDVLRRGLPFPIVSVVEHFTVKMVNSLWMWGRRYWTAGHYSSYLLWSSFVGWFLTNVLLHAVLWYGGLMLAFTGILQLSAALVFTSVQSHGHTLRIHLGYYDSDAVLTPTYGWCFWLCIAVGCLCVFLGLLIMLADKTCNSSLKHFFLKSDKAGLEEFEVESIACPSTSRSRSPSGRLSVSGEKNQAYSDADEPQESPGSSANGIQPQNESPSTNGIQPQNESPSPKSESNPSLNREELQINHVKSSASDLSLPVNDERTPSLDDVNFATTVA